MSIPEQFHKALAYELATIIAMNAGKFVELDEIGFTVNVGNLTEIIVKHQRAALEGEPLC